MSEHRKQEKRGCLSFTRRSLWHGRCGGQVFPGFAVQNSSVAQQRNRRNATVSRGKLSRADERQIKLTCLWNADAHKQSVRSWQDRRGEVGSEGSFMENMRPISKQSQTTHLCTKAKELGGRIQRNQWDISSRQEAGGSLASAGLQICTSADNRETWSSQVCCSPATEDRSELILQLVWFHNIPEQ